MIIIRLTFYSLLLRFVYHGSTAVSPAFYIPHRMCAGAEAIGALGPIATCYWLYRAIARDGGWTPASINNLNPDTTHGTSHHIRFPPSQSFTKSTIATALLARLYRARTEKENRIRTFAYGPTRCLTTLTLVGPPHQIKYPTGTSSRSCLYICTA